MGADEAGRAGMTVLREPVDVFADRATTVSDAIAGRHPGRAVAVFAHGGVIGQAMAHAGNSDPYPFDAAGNASVPQQIVTSEDRWRIRRFNDTARPVTV
jgi:probable phosphoglycerate mutase